MANPRITWTASSDQPTTVAFEPVGTTAVRLNLTSAAPGTGTGFLRISTLNAG